MYLKIIAKKNKKKNRKGKEINHTNNKPLSTAVTKRLQTQGQ